MRNNRNILSTSRLPNVKQNKIRLHIWISRSALSDFILFRNNTYSYIV